MSEIKVKQTELYKDSQGEHIVCKGKLVLIEIKTHKISKGDLVYNEAIENFQVQSYNVSKESNTINTALKLFKPILISETEEIEVGDKYLMKFNDKWELMNPCIDKSEADRCNSNDLTGKSCFKILALPEYFSPKHLQAIVDGKLKDGDEVFVDCDQYASTTIFGRIDAEERAALYYIISLDSNNYIKLFPVIKEITYHGKPIEYWKQNAKEDYITTPISVLRYIHVLEEQLKKK